MFGALNAGLTPLARRGATEAAPDPSTVTLADPGAYIWSGEVTTLSATTDVAASAVEIQYSDNAGSTWTKLADAVGSGTSWSYDWTPSDTFRDEWQLRAVANGGATSGARTVTVHDSTSLAAELVADASYLTLVNTDKISAWATRRGSIANYSQATSGRQMIWTGSYVETVFGDTNGSYMDASAAMNAANSTRIARVGSATKSVLNNEFLADSFPGRHAWNSPRSQDVTLYAGTVRDTNLDWAVGKQTAVALYNGASSFARINGTQSANVNPGPQALDTDRFGSAHNATSSGAWDVYCYRIFGRALSAAEIAAHEADLEAEFP